MCLELCVHATIHACASFNVLILATLSRLPVVTINLSVPCRKAPPQDRLTIRSFVTTCWAQAREGHSPQDMCLCVCMSDLKWRQRNIPGPLSVLFGCSLTWSEMHDFSAGFIVIGQFVLIIHPCTISLFLASQVDSCQSSLYMLGWLWMLSLVTSGQWALMVCLASFLLTYTSDDTVDW